NSGANRVRPAHAVHSIDALPAGYSGQYSATAPASAAHMAACAHQRHFKVLSNASKLAPDTAASARNTALLRSSAGNSPLSAGLLPLRTRNITTTPSRPKVIAAAEPKMIALRTASGRITGSPASRLAWPSLAAALAALLSEQGAIQTGVRSVLDRSAASL